jgi:hypothetical protein
VIETISKALTPVLVLLGWAVVSDLQDFRETRKDRAARLDGLRSRVAEVAERAIAFHIKAFDAQEALLLTTDIGILGKEIGTLHRYQYMPLDATHQLIDFRKACTGQNSVESEHKVLAPEDPVCIGIMAARAKLDDVLSQNIIRTVTANRSVWASIKHVLFVPTMDQAKRVLNGKV